MASTATVVETSIREVSSAVRHC